MQVAAPCEMPSSVTGPVGSRRVDDRLQIVGPLIERQGAAVPVAHAAAALVVAHEPAVRREELDPVLPDRALPLVLEMREPVGGLDHDRTGARFGPRQARPVRRGDVANVLAKLRRASSSADRDICLTSGPAIPAEPGQSADGRGAAAGAFSLRHRRECRAETSAVLRLRRRVVSDLPRHVSLRDRVRRRVRRAEPARRPAADVAPRRAGDRLRAADHLRRAAQRDGAAVVQGTLDADRAVDHRALHLRAVREPGAAAAVLAVASDRHRDLVGRKRRRPRRAVDAVCRRLGDGPDRSRSSSTTSICSACDRCGCR